MPVPSKGSKPINHRDRQYRWNVKSVGKFSELYVELVEVISGQMLVVESPRIFDWEIIPEAIDWANANGWTPTEDQPDMRIRFTRKGFLRV